MSWPNILGELPWQACVHSLAASADAQPERHRAHLMRWAAQLLAAPWQ